MAVICYNDQYYPAGDGETLLNVLLKHDVPFPHSCKNGTCQSCLTKLVKGEVPPEAQRGLKPTLVAKNYFLACQCRPSSDMAVVLPKQGSDVNIAANISELSMLNHNVLCVRLVLDSFDDFKAGQYINLVVPGNIIRSYSIANVPTEYIELHVKLMPDGLMSDWLSKQTKVGDSVHIRGPLGDCFYCNLDGQSFSIVLAGTGTGLAPLIGIANDALINGHCGTITLIHGGVNDADLYLHETLNALQKTHANFTYKPCVLGESTSVRQASIDSVLIESLEGITNDVHLFICGPEETTKQLKMKAFLAGVASASIYSDAFTNASLGN